VGDAADVVRTERGGDDRFIFQQDPRQQLKVEIALRFLEKDRASPSVLARFYFFKIPVRAFDQTNGESCAASAAPIEQIAQVVFCISQISLDHDADVRPISKFAFGEERFERSEER